MKSISQLLQSIEQQEREFVKAFCIEAKKIKDFSDQSLADIFFALYDDLEIFLFNHLTQRIFLRLRPHPIYGPTHFNNILQTLSYGLNETSEEQLNIWFGKSFLFDLKTVLERIK